MLHLPRPEGIPSGKVPRTPPHPEGIPLGKGCPWHGKDPRDSFGGCLSQGILWIGIGGFLCSNLNLPFEKLIAFYFPEMFFYLSQIIISVIIYGLIFIFFKRFKFKIE